MLYFFGVLSLKTNVCSILKFYPVSLGHVDCRIVLAIIEIVITLAQVENSIKGLKIPFFASLQGIYFICKCSHHP